MNIILLRNPRAYSSEMLSQWEELPLLLKEETEQTPTDATTRTLLNEAVRMLRKASNQTRSSRRQQ